MLSDDHSVEEVHQVGVNKAISEINIIISPWEFCRPLQLQSIVEVHKQEIFQ